MTNMRVVIVAAMLVLGQSPKGIAASREADILSPGKFQAVVANMVCASCPFAIQKTLYRFPVVRNVQVTMRPPRVAFQVRKGRQLHMQRVQYALNQAAADIGMGADFTLSELHEIRD